jgi:histidine triad (HIT) family protein
VTDTASICLFCRIVAKEIPADVVYETDDVLAIRDIAPAAPVHVLLIPKAHRVDAADLLPGDAPLLSELLQAAQVVAANEGVASSGYRLVVNVGADGGNTVPHLHLHLLGARALSWPPG